MTHTGDEAATRKVTRTWVGRFCVVDGRVHEEGPWLGSLIRQRPDEDPDELYVLVEPASETSAEYSRQLVDVIAQLYSRDPLSLTGALVRSLRAAHEHLRDWNRKSLKEHRVGAGASCLALRGTEAYLAQVGPSVAYHLRADGGFDRWHAEAEDFESALGIAEQFEPKLRRITLAPGDLVVIASSRLERTVPAEQLRRILERGADDALPELYLLCRDEPDMALVLLSCFEEEVALPPDFLTRAGEPLSPPDDDRGPAAADMADTVGAGVSRGPTPATASLAMGGMAVPPPMQGHAEAVREIAAATPPPVSPGVRIRGDGTPRFRRTTGSAPIPQLRFPRLGVLAVLAVVALVALVVWQLPRSVEENREERFTQLLAAAREANARAQATSDPGLRRQLLGQAQADLDDAANIHDDNGELVSLQADVDAGLGVLDAIFEVRELTPIADLAQMVTGSLSVSRTVIGGGNAYFLDAKGRRVLRFPLDGGTAPETVLEDGGLAGAIVAARPVQIAWSEQTQALVILDEQRQAFAYFAERGTLPLTVRGSDGWGSLDAIASTGGNLYLLDVEGDQVWRYLPGQGGFDSERTGLLEGASLDAATEIAVGQDLYVLDSNAGIRRFAGKAETPFPLAGIDRPLMSAASLSVLPGSNRIVVADRGNKRIVVASAEGAFLRQIVSPNFTDLRAAAVDEGTNALYVLNGDTLMRAVFPP